MSIAVKSLPMFRCQISIRILSEVSENRSARIECLCIHTNQEACSRFFDVIDTRCWSDNSQDKIQLRRRISKDASFWRKIVIKDLNSYGMLDLAGILAKSSNAGAGYASDRISEDEFYSRILSFGFTEKTGIGSPG